MRRVVCLSVVIAAATLSAAPAGAASSVPQASVAVVQMPAWLERGGASLPLVAGMEVKNGDRIRTGADARAFLKLAEGSSLKLGENAALDFYSRSLKPASNFKGAFDLKSGALRFTSSSATRNAGQRDVTIRVGGKASAAVHGADLWASTNAERDQILLIEGQAELRNGEQVLEMNAPLTAVSIARNAAEQNTAALTAAEARQRMDETALTPGHGLLQPGGQWRVLLARAASQPEALGVYDSARAAGYAVQVKVKARQAGNAASGDQWNYDVLVANLASQQDAATLAGKISQQLGVAALAEQ